MRVFEDARRRKVTVRGFSLFAITITLFALCAAGSFAANDERVAAGSGDGAAEAVHLAPLSVPPAKPAAQYFLTGKRIIFQRLRIARSLYLDREGRIYLDFNTSLSFGVKPVMGSLDLWAESHSAADFLRGLSVSVYVRY